jgi:hypothetical protein
MDDSNRSAVAQLVRGRFAPLGEQPFLKPVEPIHALAAYPAHEGISDDRLNHRIDLREHLDTANKPGGVLIDQVLEQVECL